MADQPGADLSQITPDQFAELVAGASDSEIADTIHQVGTEPTLERIFKGFEERFRPDRAQGVDEVIQFVVTDDGTQHPYVVSIKAGSCTTSKGTADDPKAALETDLVSFAKLVTGQADGIRLFMARKLKVAGDLMFAQRIMGFFDRPGT
jgi:putative sterol carrier protein